MSGALSKRVCETSDGKASSGPRERSWQQKTEASHRHGYLCHRARCRAFQEMLFVEAGEHLPKANMPSLSRTTQYLPLPTLPSPNKEARREFAILPTHAGALQYNPTRRHGSQVVHGSEDPSVPVCHVSDMHRAWYGASLVCFNVLARLEDERQLRPWILFCCSAFCSGSFRGYE